MPGEGASIGEVYVDILPNLDNFTAKVRAQIGTQAGRVGDEVGKQMGDSISDRIAKGIRDGLSNSARGEAARAGEQSGTAYAAAFKQRVEAALRALPDAKIGLDSSRIDRDLRDVRTQLERLRDRSITVNVDVTKAYVDVVTLREELDKLGRTRPSVRADADTAAAMAQVAALIAEVERLGRLNPTIRPDVDDSGVRAVGSAARDSSSGISALAAAGTLLGPALVPGAAAGVQAIAGITPMALGAAGGLAVLTLAVSGVAGAVKAMSAADNQATQSAVSLAGNQSRLAAAADGVRSAQASLANTTANAADSQRRASQSIANAELSEADAHRTLLQAQQAVTQARIDAARAAEDLSSRVAHNALDQRQAVLDEAKAQQALAAAKQTAGADPTSTAAQDALTQAQLAYDQQKQRNEDLIRDGKRLTDEKTKGDKAGIDGSTQVVSALDKVRQATEQVHKAEQSTADARAAYATQARQSAASIVAAQQSVVSAQRAVQQATEQTATVGGSAMLALQQSMQNLSPEGQRFAAFIYGLRTPLLSIRQAAEGGLLPGLQAGIEAMLPTVPRITGYVRAFSTEVGKLASEAGKAFASPYWAGFSDLLVGKSIPAMGTAALVAGNFALGISGLVTAALPLGQDFGGGLLRFSQQFAAHALTLQNSQGYRDFLTYVREVGPQVAHTIGEVVTAAVRLVEAIGPLGGISLTTIRLLAQTINAMPVGVLTVLAGGIGAVVLASKGMAIWSTLGPMMTTAIEGIATAFRGMQIISAGAMFAATTAMTTAAEGGAGAFGRMFAGIRAGAANAGSSIGLLARTIGPGGVLGIALAAGALAIIAFANAHEQARAKEAQHKSNVVELTDAIKQNSGAIDANVRKIGAKQAYDDGALTAAKNAGVSVGLVTDAYIKGGGALGDIISQQETYITTETKAAATDQAHQTTHLTNIKNSRALIAVLEDRRKAADGNESATRAMAEADKLATGAAYEQTPAQKALGDALNILANATSTAAQKADALRAADEAVFGGMRAAITTADASAASQDNLTAKLKAYTDEHGRNTAAFDSNTAAGRDNRTALEQRLTAVNNVFFADVQAGVAIDEATKKHDINRDAVAAAATATGTDKDQVDKLVLAFGTLPTDPRVVVTVSGVADAMNQLETAQIAQFGLMHGLSPQEATNQWQEQKRELHREANRAQGGPIYGPGTGTSDSIPAIGPGGARYRLSNDEHIVTAAEVRAAGGHGAIMAWRQMLLGGMSPQALYPGDGSGGVAFATGGPVRPKSQPSSAAKWPFNVNAAGTKIPKAFDFLGAGAGGVAGTLQWLRAQVGKPYIWASAGPDGYDCSGLISATYRLLHGLTPYVHQFSTMDEGAYFPKTGYGGALTVGWTNPGERGPGGDGVGHTAGILAGLPFESVGGQGVRIGPGVTPVSSFAHIGHYDSGGDLPPGLTIAYNGTGQTEQVYTAGDHAKAQAALSGASGGRDRGLVHIDNFHAVGVEPHAVAYELDWQMRGLGG